jgi:hypothetical protein
MGRPLYKDVNGVDVRGTTVSALGIRVDAYFSGSLRADVFIMKQAGARKYKVQDISDSTTGFCKLVSGTPSANGEMKITGYINGQTGSPVVINKLQKRTAIDWSGNRYTWVVQNDSSADIIILTPIA